MKKEKERENETADYSLLKEYHDILHVRLFQYKGTR